MRPSEPVQDEEPNRFSYQKKRAEAKARTAAVREKDRKGKSWCAAKRGWCDERGFEEGARSCRHCRLRGRARAEESRTNNPKTSRTRSVGDGIKRTAELEPNDLEFAAAKKSKSAAQHPTDLYSWEIDFGDLPGAAELLVFMRRNPIGMIISE